MSMIFVTFCYHFVNNLFFHRNCESHQKASEIAATEELQRILSFTPTCETSSYLPGRLERPILALSPSPREFTPSYPEQVYDNIPSRSDNPLALNTPFVSDQSLNQQGAELGLLSPSPPPNIIVTAPIVNIKKLQNAERKQKRMRSISCPEAKHLLK